MIRKGLRPPLRIGLERRSPGERFRQVFPLRKSWKAIAFLLVLDAVFIFPAVATLRETIGLWSRPDDLFNLVAALFTTFWLLGWSMAPLLMTLALAVLLFGREVVVARAGAVEVFLGLPLFGATMHYDAVRMRNLRLEPAAEKPGKRWRGDHVTFDYGANTGDFGIDVSAAELPGLLGRLESATGVRPRRGEALPEELEGAWGSGILAALKPSRRAARATAIPAPAGAAEDISLASPTTLALIAANLIPLAGAAFANWDLSMLLVLYWAESAIIGVFNLCKMVVIGKWAALFFGPFFLGHFGGFMAVHFMFIYEIFVKGAFAGSTSSGDLGEVLRMFAHIWPALAVLFLSHGYSFWHNFLGRREYLDRSIGTQMGEPYGRIVFMQLVIIFGGGLSMFLGDPTPVLMLVIALKILFDVRGHLKQHRARENAALPGRGVSL